MLADDEKLQVMVTELDVMSLAMPVNASSVFPQLPPLESLSSSPPQAVNANAGSIAISQNNTFFIVLVFFSYM